MTLSELLGDTDEALLDGFESDPATVLWVQRRLNQLSASTGDASLGGLKEDGLYGPATKAALLHYNRDWRGAPGDGSAISAGTLAQLASATGTTAPTSRPPAVRRPTSGSPPPPVVTAGASGGAAAALLGAAVIAGGVLLAGGKKRSKRRPARRRKA